MAFPWAPVIAAAGEIGSSLMGGGGGQQKFRQAPTTRNWAREMARKYPEFKELALGPESMALASRMMGGGLVPGVEQAYGAGAEREVGGLRSTLSEIGAGPASMGLARAGVMGRLGTDVAGARERAVTAGMGFAPQAFEMGMQPYQAERAKWGDIANMFLQAPGAAYLRGKERGYGMPGYEEMRGTPGYESPATGWDPNVQRYGQPAATPAQTAMQNRMTEQQPGMAGASQYPLTPMQQAWQRMRGQKQPTPAPAPMRQASYGYGYRG